jgi:hypothetical protein
MFAKFIISLFQVCFSVYELKTTHAPKVKSKALYRGGIKIFKALARLASNSEFLLAKSVKNSPKTMSLRARAQLKKATKLSIK